MGFSKLREWVETVTGKGDRWGRDSVGRSAPAFLAASTTVLPPLTCTARREAGQHRQQLLFLLQGRPTAGCCFEACAGRRVRRLCPPAVAGSAGCVLPAANFAMSCPLPSTFLPPFILLCPVHFASFAPVHFHVRQDQQCQTIMFASCKTVLLAAATRACSGGPCAGSFVDSFAPFSCRVHDPGPWCSVNNKVKLCVVNMCAPPACLLF